MSGRVRVIETDILVIGGGFAGLSTAYHLSLRSRRRVTVIEREKKLGGHSSGRNAGMIRQAVSDPVLARLAGEGRRALSRASRRWKRFRLFPNGSLLIGQGSQLRELARIRRTLSREGIASRWVSREEAARRVWLLCGGRFDRGLFCASDAMVDIGALLNGFLGALKSRGIPVYRGLGVRAIVRSGSTFVLSAGKTVIVAQKIVNAAGACAGLIGRQANASRIPLTAYRRHLFMSRKSRRFDKTWPFVWDLSHQFYFRPLKKALLMSPCDKSRVSDRYSDAGKEKCNPRMKKVLLKTMKTFSTEMGRLPIGSPVSGLRTMTPDGRFVIGEDGAVNGFYWVAGLGGHGVTTSFSVGRLAADLVLGRKTDPGVTKAVSPTRFIRR